MRTRMRRPLLRRMHRHAGHSTLACCPPLTPLQTPPLITRSMQNLFVREIDTGLSREQVVAELSKVCPPAAGRVVVPVSDSTGGVLGIAYLNYTSAAEGGL